MAHNNTHFDTTSLYHTTKQKKLFLTKRFLSAGYTILVKHYKKKVQKGLQKRKEVLFLHPQ
jgi:hypothetical protein